MFQQWICQKTQLLPPDGIQLVRHFSELNASYLRALTRSLFIYFPVPFPTHYLSVSLPCPILAIPPYWSQLPSLIIFKSLDCLLPVFGPNHLSCIFFFVTLAGRRLAELCGPEWFTRNPFSLFSLELILVPFSIALQITAHTSHWTHSHLSCIPWCFQKGYALWNWHDFIFTWMGSLPPPHAGLALRWWSSTSYPNCWWLAKFGEDQVPQWAKMLHCRALCGRIGPVSKTFRSKGKRCFVFFFPPFLC